MLIINELQSFTHHICNCLIISKMKNSQNRLLYLSEYQYLKGQGAEIISAKKFGGGYIVS